ncbi:selenoprotein Flags: Precursor [Monoraphidium neglectum]|uniref:Selenoprotein F n=1 Tax=Monoraphidium neglectum TaxID=145388 RepID=A0A0D2NT97_9CHLO|nr:selenoprotein Flags: Precursor [Monoraphidium neglectum]KIZ07426.1 selenoprotein Flags: Precursor [Monoraphidium neglectum]|eukprot:XP_013906445.1 selenoprotein Flags: Precursor [Monoraphidium neglectum]
MQRGDRVSGRRGSGIFTGLASCSDCDLLGEYLPESDALLADCKACCVKDVQEAAKFTKAVIELCPFKRAGLPQIEEFIKKQKKAFGAALSVREYPGAYPKLVLSDKASGAHSSIRIDNWRASTIAEYLRDKLTLPAAAAAGKKAAAS